ncbi:MAG: SRPBCC family protein [Acidobacteriota bacterium]|nr:SRPBCC family protein [Acidobacteriota bacterium]
MNIIRLTTWINAPVERCFQLSLNIDLHVASAQSTREKAVAGVTSGFIREGETVTFQGWHFGLPRRHTSLFGIVRPSSHIRNVMEEGSFQHFEHDLYFAAMDDGTRIRDEIRFSLPHGALGRLARRLYVRKHLVTILAERNAYLKQVAESEEWRRYLPNHPAADRRKMSRETELVPATWARSA